MFTTDTSAPHTILTVRHPVRLGWYFQAQLGPGIYHLRGDFRSKVTTVAEQEKIVAGIYSLEYVDPRKAAVKTPVAETKATDGAETEQSTTTGEADKTEAKAPDGEVASDKMEVKAPVEPDDAVPVVLQDDDTEPA